MVRAARAILLGQGIFYTGLVVCVLLKPDGLSANDGISYYGIFRETFLPYAIGLLGAAYLTVYAVETLPAKERLLRISLRAYALLVIAIAITPYSVGRWVSDIHTICGTVLFSLQLLLSCQLVWQQQYIWWGVALALVELASGIASAIYLSPAHGLLLQAQVAFQLAFGTLLILYLQASFRGAKATASESTPQ